MIYNYYSKSFSYVNISIFVYLYSFLFTHHYETSYFSISLFSFNNYYHLNLTYIFFFFYLFIYYYYNHSSMKSYKTSIFPIIQSDIKLNKLYHLHKKLSNGCFGYLFLVTNKLTNRTSALKI